jgi:hypothetical protein
MSQVQAAEHAFSHLPAPSSNTHLTAPYTSHISPRTMVPIAVDAKLPVGAWDSHVHVVDEVIIALL